MPDCFIFFSQIPVSFRVTPLKNPLMWNLWLCWLQLIFQEIVASFHGLDEVSSPSFSRRIGILETLAKVRTCIVMLDLELETLLREMFDIFFNGAW